VALAQPAAKPKRATAGGPEAILFPLVGVPVYRDDFGDPRGSGSHEANDIVAGRRAPVVAVEPGTIRFHNRSARAGCMIYLYGASGTTYLYIHLNNDRTSGNDNRGDCGPGVSYAPGLADGARVDAGTLIGYVGDSGDANWAGPHLHFELHPGGGDAVSPFSWLGAAPRLLYAVADTELARARAAAIGGLRLALTGVVTAFDGSTLTLQVSRVRPSSGDRPFAVDRPVTLALAPAALVQRSVGGRREAAALAADVVGQHAVVWTAPFVHSLAAQLADPGVLTAAQVLLRPPP
jgi:hypothetical protein